jgi:ATP-dependent DNA helicase RecG
MGNKLKDNAELSTHNSALATSESHNVEWKQSWQDDYLKWICGFANAQGGRIYIGSMTQLRVMDDRLSLWNAGTLPVELTVDKLFQVHESVPRNPLIAEVCYRAGYIDSWGRGIKKITDACKYAGLPAPVISERTGGIVVELLKTPVKTPVKTPDAIIQILKEDNCLTLADVAHQIGKSVSAVERATKKLREQGRLKYVGPQKGGHWEVMDNERQENQ